MILPVLALIGGLALLVWSADRFIDGAVALARRLGAPALLIGMVIVGFGTSAPEMLVSCLGAWHGTPGIALGNAYGSNITNIALILGVTALLRPITVQSGVLRTELPLLAAVTALAVWQSWDGQVTREGAIVLLCVFGIVLSWMVWQGMRRRGDALGHEMEQELASPARAMSIQRALIWLVVGLALLIAASRLLVWGAVEIARGAGVSELVIGLTVVACGTSLPELASSIASARKGEHDIALGNILGSNIFNTLCVVGMAGVIAPMDVGAGALTRDLLVMSGLTAALFVVGIGLRGAGRINRIEGGLLLAAYVGYVGYLVGVSL